MKTNTSQKADQSGERRYGMTTVIDETSDITIFQLALPGADVNLSADVKDATRLVTMDVDGYPQLSPAQARELADALRQAADEAEQLTV